MTVHAFIFHGLLQWHWLSMLVLVLIMTHLTNIGVSLYLHRSIAHRAIDLHPIVSHALRFWIWLTTAMVTKEWVAIHRKHHTTCDTEEDPHSPHYFGIWKVLFGGAWLYSDAAKNRQMVEQFGKKTPNDWVENHIYTPYSHIGLFILLGIELVCFGLSGFVIWAIQMIWIPLWAAGVVNGLGHFMGYRNHGTDDKSKNIMPLGIIMCGEELHNNHHHKPTSAKFSTKAWEFDIGWLYIKLLRGLNLVKLVAE